MNIEKFDPVVYEKLLVKTIEKSITEQEIQTLCLLLTLAIKTDEGRKLSKEIEDRIIPTQK